MTVKDINGSSYKIPVPTGDCAETIASLWYDRGKFVIRISEIKLIKWSNKFDKTESDDTSVFVTVQAAMGKIVVLGAKEREIKQA